MNHTPVLFRAVASTLAANGYRPVPIKPGEKRPPLVDWQHFAYAPGDEARFGNCGAGVLLGHDLVAVDIDVEDPDAAAAIEAAVREIIGVGEVAEIPRRVGNPPRVLLPFRAAAPFKKMKSASFTMLSTGTAGHVELLAEGQQFVAFHVHPATGRPYTWNGGGDLLAIPRAELFELTEAQAVAIIAAAESILEDWGERVVEKRDDKAAGATPGDEIPEGARDDSLYRYGCKLARDRCTAAEIEAALFTLNARCKPPLPEADVRRIAHQAAKHIPPQQEDPPPAEPAAMPSIYSIAEMAQRPDVEREWIVDQWLPARSNVVIGGHGGSGKSMLMAMLAVCINTGVSFYGLPVERRGPVIVYACEDDVDEWKYRLQCAARYRRLDFDSLSTHVIDALEAERDPALFAPPATDPRADAMITPVGLYLAAQVKAIEPALIVIDAAADAFGGDEIRRREVRRYLRTMRRELATICGACVVHVLHVDKTAVRGKTTTDLYSGSTDWNNGVRARLAFYRPQAEDAQEDGLDERNDEGSDSRLELQKANYAKRGAFVDLRYDEFAHVFEQVGGSALTGSEDLVSAIHRRADEHSVLRSLAAAEDADDPVHSSERANRNAAARLAAIGVLPAAYRGKTGKRRLFALLLRLKAEGLLAEGSEYTEARNRRAVWNVTAAGRVVCGAPIRPVAANAHANAHANA